jgi:predicted phage tail protein
MRYVVVALMLALSGCAWFGGKDRLPPLPEKGTTDGLSMAERELDAATDNRLSKIGASVAALEDLLEDVDGKEVNAALWELEITKMLAGIPSPEDNKAAQARVSKFMGDNANEAYDAAMKGVSTLMKQIAEADKKYEFEKAKKQAEFEAKLVEREQEIAREKELRKIESELAQKEKVSTIFTIVGAVLFVAGIAFFPLSKYLGMSPLWGVVISGGGLVAGAVPFLVNHEWFIYISGGAILISVIGGWIVFSRAERCMKRKVIHGQEEPKADKFHGES